MDEHSTYLTPEQLAARWSYSVRTLANWRVKGTGPEYIRVGPRRVLYPLDVVSRWEAERQVAASR